MVMIIMMFQHDKVAKTVADETTVIGNVDHTSSQDLSTSDQDTGLVNQQRGGELKCWKPEDAAFWAGEGPVTRYLAPNPAACWPLPLLLLAPTPAPASPHRPC